jgi:Adaptin N terminal region
VPSRYREKAKPLNLEQAWCKLPHGIPESLHANSSTDHNMHTSGTRKPVHPIVSAQSDMQNRKEAIQKTIMAMTLGKDVSALFPDVLKNIATADLDQKKLVYLYLMFVRMTKSFIFLNLLTKLKELCQIPSRPLYSSRKHLCSGLGRPQSFNTSPCNTYNGMYSSRKNGRLHGRTIEKNLER